MNKNAKIFSHTSNIQQTKKNTLARKECFVKKKRKIFTLHFLYYECATSFDAKSFWACFHYVYYYINVGEEKRVFLRASSLRIKF